MLPPVIRSPRQWKDSRVDTNVDVRPKQMVTKLKFYDLELLADGGALAIALPRLLLAEGVVSSGPYLDRARQEERVLSTRGSVDWFTWEPVDEFRFDRRTGRLTSVALRLPDTTFLADLHGASVSASRGTVRLDPVRDFFAPATRYRHYRSDDTLFCFDRNVVTKFEEIEVASGLWLLFASDGYCGWRLAEASRVLADADDSPVADDVSCDLLRECLAEYFDLTSEQRIDELISGEALQRLRSIAARLQSNGGQCCDGCRILLRQVEDLLREWSR
ncbi:hypothetical protein ACFXPA_35280 [Amycolatopsis sp. NPDC059090]|uniref:hypothetical protein n=1 Tax=unclassified Amycolatopsis TaxID=2618356 RepID=UPI00366B66D9